MWCDALDGHADWRAIFAGYRSSVDWPACAFYAEQLAAYPTARVILTVREPGAWYRSTRETIYPLSRIFPPRWLCWFSRSARDARRMVYGIVWDGQFDGRFEDEDYATRTFVDHIETVKRKVPRERLLIFDVRDGWAPLCEFLGRDAPPEPFPHVNDGATLKAALRNLRLALAAFYGVLALLIVWGIRALAT
jgi:hypothetical protein